MSANAFDLCLPKVLAQECPFPSDWSNPKNFSNDRWDKGGATMCGILQREYDHYRKMHGILTQPVNLISKAEGYWIYEYWYWLPHAPVLPSGLDLSFFDSCVNEGSTEAIKILQVALSVENDGIWGPETAAAVSRLPTAAAVNLFAARRTAVYEEIVQASPNQRVFLDDWLRRTKEIKEASLEMTNATV